MHQALNLIRPRTLPRNRSGVMAAKTNWNQAKESVGKWKGMTVLAADTAWPSSPTELVIPPGLPTKFSKRCLTHPTLESWVGTPFLTPPPTEVAPKPIL